MKEVELRRALEEVERFKIAARVAISALQQDDFYYGGKETAAAKRASMDLTRALADIRRRG